MCSHYSISQEEFETHANPTILVFSVSAFLAPNMKQRGPGVLGGGDDDHLDFTGILCVGYRGDLIHYDILVHIYVLIAAQETVCGYGRVSLIS